MKWKNSDIIKNPEAFKCLPDFRFVLYRVCCKIYFIAACLKLNNMLASKKTYSAVFSLSTGMKFSKIILSQ